MVPHPFIKGGRTESPTLAYAETRDCAGAGECLESLRMDTEKFGGLFDREQGLKCNCGYELFRQADSIQERRFAGLVFHPPRGTPANS